MSIAFAAQANRPGRRPGRERRRNPRTRISSGQALTLTLGRKSIGILLDISESGVGIRCREPMTRGATTTLQFEIPGSRQRIEAKAVVSWTDDSRRAGVSFTQISTSTRAALAQWLLRLAADEFALGARGGESKAGNDPEVLAIEREIASRALDGDAALALIAERSRVLTRADGAAIALAGAEGITCRASSGNAPDVGVPLLPNSGLSGECIRTGVVVRCEDTELDPRVDRDACRALKLRSAVVVPLVLSEYTVIGLLEVFSSTHHAFQGRHVLLLRQIAELITCTVAGQPPQTTTATAILEPAIVPEMPPAEPTHGTTVEPLVTGPVICDVCGTENLPFERDCQTCDVPLPAAVQGYAGVDMADMRTPPRIESTQAVTRRNSRRSTVRRVAAFSGVLLLGGLAVTAGTTESLNRWRVQLPQIPWSLLTAAISSSSAPSVPVELAPVVKLPPEASRVATEPTKPAIVAVFPPAPTPVAETRDRKKENGRTAGPAAASFHPAQPPALAVAGPDTPVVAVLSAPTALPALSAISKGVKPARLIHRVDPVYPAAAVKSRIEGKVVLKAIISRTGAISSVHLEEGNQVLAEAAVRAVRQWRYTPQELDGETIEAETTITFNFSQAN